MYLTRWMRMRGRFVWQNVRPVGPYNYMKINIVRVPRRNANLPIGVPGQNPSSGRLHGKRLAPNKRDLHPNG